MKAVCFVVLIIIASLLVETGYMIGNILILLSGSELLYEGFKASVVCRYSFMLCCSFVLADSR